MFLSCFGLIYGKTPSKSLNRVPLSINRPRGHLPVTSYILSFSAYQTTYFHKVSCFYRVLQLIYRKTPSKAWNRVPLSKNSTRGHLPEDICILFFPAYQTFYFDKVSCFYLVLQDFFININYKVPMAIEGTCQTYYVKASFEWHHF